MPIIEIKDFAALKTSSRAIMGVDYGDTMGIAVTDSRWSIASPLQNISNKKFTKAAEEVFKIIDERNIIGIVIGLPLNMDGTENKKCQSVRQFGRNLIKLRDINITFFDERFSTVVAEKMLSATDMSYSKKGEVVDKIAAGYILQSFLDAAERTV